MRRRAIFATVITGALVAAPLTAAPLTSAPFASASAATPRTLTNIVVPVDVVRITADPVGRDVIARHTKKVRLTVRYAVRPGWGGTDADAQIQLRGDVFRGNRRVARGVLLANAIGGAGTVRPTLQFRNAWGRGKFRIRHVSASWRTATADAAPAIQHLPDDHFAGGRFVVRSAVRLRTAFTDGRVAVTVRRYTTSRRWKPYRTKVRLQRVHRLCRPGATARTTKVFRTNKHGKASTRVHTDRRPFRVVVPATLGSARAVDYNILCM